MIKGLARSGNRLCHGLMPGMLTQAPFSEGRLLPNDVATHTELAFVSCRYDKLRKGSGASRAPSAAHLRIWPAAAHYAFCATMRMRTRMASAT